MERGLAGLNDKVNTLSGFSDKISALTDQFESFQMGLHSRNPDTPVTLAQILEWLDAVYTANEYERALCARLEGTCEWMFQRSVFHLWRTVDLESDVTKILWIHGAPGFGKTILCASIIDFLRHSVEGPVCYFFCDFGHDSKRHPQAILRSWIAQLVKHGNEAYSLTLNHFRERNGRTATDLELWSLFRKLSLSILSCFFVIDGFDECLRNSQGNKKHSVTDERTRFLHQLAYNLDHTGSRVLLVSREVSEIRDEFMKGWQNASTPNKTSGSREVVLRNTDQISFLDYHITRADTAGDIESFANSIAAARLPNKHTQLQQDLAQTASDKCDGMFLWIRLLYDRLSPGKNTKQLQRVISETPAGLEQAYERDLMSIAELPDDERERALSILQWVLFGRRPLTIRELTEALLVDIDDLTGSFPKEDLPDAWDEYFANETIRKPCGSLIELRGQAVDGSIAEMTVHLVHFSVKEFLLTTDNVKHLLTLEPRFMNSIHVNKIIARKCLTYLCYEELYRDHHSQKEDILELSKKHAFLNYALDSWHQHVISREEHSPELVDIVNHFLDPSVTRWMLFSDYRFYQSQYGPEDVERYLSSSPLHIASEYGLLATINCLMSQDVEIDLVCGQKGTSLHAAILNGQDEAVKLLLANGASPTFAEPSFGDALHYIALAHGKPNVQTILKMLLQSGADLEGTNNEHQATPLQYAVAMSFKDLVLWLLEAGAEVHTKGSALGMTPLIAASSYGYQEVVDVLLHNGANVNFVDSAQRTALFHAAGRGHVGVVDFLLREGAEVDAVDNNKFQALHIASFQGKRDVIVTLIQSGADVKAVDSRGMTALFGAAANGQTDTVKVLLESGADVKDVDRIGMTALIYAAANGQTDTVKVLLESGAEVNAVDHKETTALFYAAANDQTDAVKTLLESGVEVNAVDNEGRTALSWAAEKGHESAAMTLLERGASSNIADNNSLTPLHYATMCGSDTDLAKGNHALSVLLLDHGADIEMGYNGWTPLMFATMFSLVKIFRALLSRGANTQAVSNNGDTLFDAAMTRGNLKIFQLLLEHKDSPQAWYDQTFALMQWVSSKKIPSARARNVSGNWESYIRLHRPEVILRSDDLKHAEPSNFDLVIRRRDTSKPVRKSHVQGMARVHFVKSKHGLRSRRGRKK